MCKIVCVFPKKGVIGQISLGASNICHYFIVFYFGISFVSLPPSSHFLGHGFHSSLILIAQVAMPTKVCSLTAAVLYMSMLGLHLAEVHVVQHAMAVVC